MFQPSPRFDALFALALYLHGSPEGSVLPWEDAAARVYELSRLEQSLPADSDMDPADLADARFAVYTFLDETLFRSPRTGETSGVGWAPHSLQNKYFSTNNGGELFYEHLEALLARLENASELPQFPQLSEMRLPPAMPLNAEGSLTDRFRAVAAQAPDSKEHRSGYAALAVYAQCLAWGFRGKLYAHEAQLDDLRGIACAALISASAPLPALEPATSPRTARMPFLADYEPLLHVLVPLSVSVAWYVLCANIIIRALPV